MSDQPSPAFLAAVVSAVKQAVAAEQTSNLPSTPATSFASSMPMAALLGGVPAFLRYCLKLGSLWLWFFIGLTSCFRCHGPR